jgi:hypothetical protein
MYRELWNENELIKDTIPVTPVARMPVQQAKVEPVAKPAKTAMAKKELGPRPMKPLRSEPCKPQGDEALPMICLAQPDVRTRNWYSLKVAEERSTANSF